MLKEIIKKAKEVDEKYAQSNEKNGNKFWSLAEYVQGFMGDVGDLAKLVMAKSGFRKKEDIDNKLSEEISDCLWSIIIIADKLGIDIEDDFFKNMEKVERKIEKL